MGDTMRNIKPKAKYQGISLPKEFIDEIKEYVLKTGEYKSIAEFTKDAIREKMESHKTTRMDKLTQFMGTKQKDDPMVKELREIKKVLKDILEK